MTDVPGTSPERAIIWSPGRPATGSRRRPVDVPIQNFCILVFPVKNSNSKTVKQELLHLKSTFFIKLSFFFCWSPKSPLKVPWRSRTLREPSGNIRGTSRAGWEVSQLLKYDGNIVVTKRLFRAMLWKRFFKPLCEGLARR